MGSILLQIGQLYEVPSINARYAYLLLDLFIKKQLSLDEVDIGVWLSGEEKGAIISFDGDELENIQLNLIFSEGRFILELVENSEENFTCTFRYKIFKDSQLYQQIPEKVGELMEEVERKSKPTIYKKNHKSS